MDAWDGFFLREAQTPPTLMSLVAVGSINLSFPLFALNHIGVLDYSLSLYT